MSNHKNSETKPLEAKPQAETETIDLFASAVGEKLEAVKVGQSKNFNNTAACRGDGIVISQLYANQLKNSIGIKAANKVNNAKVLVDIDINDKTGVLTIGEATNGLGISGRITSAGHLRINALAALVAKWHINGVRVPADHMRFVEGGTKLQLKLGDLG